MVRVLSIAVALACVSSACAIGLKLNKEYFEEDVMGKRAWLVYFFSKECTECKSFDRHWATIASKVSKLRLGRVDLDRYACFYCAFGSSNLRLTSTATTGLNSPRSLG
jgi:hypothetical protein